MTRYYFYRLKKSLPTIAVSLVLGLLFLNIGLINRYGGYYETKRFYYTDISFMYVLFYAEAFAYAYMSFSSFRNKRNLDTWFSFPLSREKLAIVHVLNVLTIYAIQVVVLGINGAAIILGHDGLNVLYFFPAILLSALFGFLLFCFCSCTFLFGNSVFDGAVNVVAWLNIPSAIGTMIGNISYIITGSFDEFFRTNMMLSPFYGISSLNDYFEYQINENVYRKMARVFDNPYYMKETSSITDEAIVSLCVWAVIFIVVIIVLPFIFSKRPTEKIGGVSDFPLSYDFIIPFYTLFMFIMAEDNTPLKLFFVIASYIAYAVYRKSPNITVKRFVVLAVFLVCAFIPFFELFGVDGYFM